ncbi:MAG: DUF3785 family protein [Clostridiaceae bacterium]
MYKFKFEDKEYELNDGNCELFFTDEEQTAESFDLQEVLSLLNEAEEVSFDKVYYMDACPECRYKKDDKDKYYEYLEYHFYIFTKDGKYVTSSISKDYEANSFGRLFRLGKFDDSFLVNITVCKNCGDCTVEIEQFEM